MCDTISKADKLLSRDWPRSRQQETVAPADRWQNTPTIRPALTSCWSCSSDSLLYCCLSPTTLLSLTCSFSLGFTSRAQIIFCMVPNSYTAGSLSQCHGNRVEGAEGKLKGKLQRNSRRVQQRKRARKGWRQEDKVTEESE